MSDQPYSQDIILVLFLLIIKQDYMNKHLVARDGSKSSKQAALSCRWVNISEGSHLSEWNNKTKIELSMRRSIL